MWRFIQRRWRWLLAGVVAMLALLPVGVVALYGVVAPPITGLMLARLAEGEELQWNWVPYDAIATPAPLAVIAAEDNQFCSHGGFDWEAIDEALEQAERQGRPPRGASTITMQTAKNLFLWPGRSYMRKGLEAYFTVLIEVLWSKRRILEVYLNVVEWGHGLYGVEAAAQAYFERPAAELSRRQAALLAAALPNPRERSPAKPSSYMVRRAKVVETRMRQLGPLLDCARIER